MIFISHRGNLTGKNSERENSPDYIDEAINSGFDVEVDLWVVNDKLFLGHCDPTYEIPVQFLIDRYRKLWIHCKDIDTLVWMVNYHSKRHAAGWPRSLNYFYYQNDPVSLTSLNDVWVHPNEEILEGGIVCLPNDKNLKELSKCSGICSDTIVWYKNEILYK